MSDNAVPPDLPLEPVRPSLWARFRALPMWAQVASWAGLALILAGIGVAIYSAGQTNEQRRIAAVLGDMAEEKQTEPTTTTEAATTTTERHDDDRGHDDHDRGADDDRGDRRRPRRPRRWRRPRRRPTTTTEATDDDRGDDDDRAATTTTRRPRRPRRRRPPKRPRRPPKSDDDHARSPDDDHDGAHRRSRWRQARSTRTLRRSRSSGTRWPRLRGPVSRRSARARSRRSTNGPTADTFVVYLSDDVGLLGVVRKSDQSVAQVIEVWVPGGDQVASSALFRNAFDVLIADAHPAARRNPARRRPGHEPRDHGDDATVPERHEHDRRRGPAAATSRSPGTPRSTARRARSAWSTPTAHADRRSAACHMSMVSATSTEPPAARIGQPLASVRAASRSLALIRL